jgi:hypothetical protein
MEFGKDYQLYWLLLNAYHPNYSFLIVTILDLVVFTGMTNLELDAKQLEKVRIAK